MCGRYTLTSPPDEVAQTFEVTVRDNFPARYNIAPSQPIAVISTPEQPGNFTRHYRLMRWGFVPEWSAKPSKNDDLPDFAAKPIINARSETVILKPSFRNAFKRRRCLVPANGFYEWKKEKGEKQPYFCQPKAAGLFAFAGIWETLLDPGGGEMDGVALLTTKAGEDLKSIHSREPVVIPQRHFDTWLNKDERDIETLFPVMKEQLPGFWQSHAVDRAVGNVRNDGEALIAPAPAAAPPSNPQGQLF